MKRPFAIVALAGAIPVVLRDGNNARVGRFAQPLFDAIDEERAELRIGRAKLGAVVGAFAVDQRIPFGMIGKMFFGRDQRIKRVNETFVLD